MSTLEITNYKTVLKTVHTWSPAMQLALVQDILKTLALELTPARPRRNTLERALGLLTTNHPAPSDAEVAEWLAEHRLEKYGR